MADSSDQLDLSELNEAYPDALPHRMGIKITEASAMRVVGTMPVLGNRAASAGWVTGVATRLHAGRTLATYEIVITDDHGRRVCTARLSCLLRDAVPGGGPPAS